MGVEANGPTWCWAVVPAGPGSNTWRVKASGGVRTTEDALKMVQAGANRIGASASVSIVTGEKPTGSKY